MFTLQLHKNTARGQGSQAEKLYPRYLGEYSARLIDILWNFTLRYVLQQRHISDIPSLYKGFTADSPAGLCNIKVYLTVA